VSEQLNSYGQVVLTALKDTEDALARESKQAEYVASLKRQLDSSAKATAQTLDNYTKGATDFTRYLTTLLSHQQLQRNYVTARRNLILYRIDLYRALAGGWELSRPPRAKVSERLQAVRSPFPERTAGPSHDAIKPAAR
ncbi:MAG: TolC family protein, partial [Anaerolineae bacterium]|nr:TolC family protein [Anaerolineae bacterium]